MKMIKSICLIKREYFAFPDFKDERYNYWMKRSADYNKFIFSVNSPATAGIGLSFRKRAGLGQQKSFTIRGAFANWTGLSLPVVSLPPNKRCMRDACIPADWTGLTFLNMFFPLLTGTYAQQVFYRV
jgi:hypothetical protein